MSQKATVSNAVVADKVQSNTRQPLPQTQEVTIDESQRSPHVPMEGVMSQAPLPDTMSAVGYWLKELAQADQNPEPIPHNSPLPSPRASVQAMQRVARKEASLSAKEVGAIIPTPVTASPTFSNQLPLAQNTPTNPSSHQEVMVRSSAEPGTEKATTSARPPTTTRVSTTAAAGMSRPPTKGAAIPSVPSSAAVTGTSSLLPSKSVIDAQVQGLLMCPGWSSIRAASKEVLLSTYSVDPFYFPLDFQQEQGTLGALGLNAAMPPPYSSSAHWAVTETKVANVEISKVATNGGGIDAASIAERVSKNKRLFAVSAGRI